MKNLLNKPEVTEVLSRIEKLTPQTQAQWGKMNVAQMLAHCSVGIQTAVGEVVVPRPLLIKLIGPFFKKGFLGTKPFPKNSPTGKAFIIADERNFNTEKEILINLINKFYSGGEKNVTHHPHGFVGKLSPQEWGVTMYKHMDHHLRQFGA